VGSQSVKVCARQTDKNAARASVVRKRGAMARMMSVINQKLVGCSREKVRPAMRREKSLPERIETNFEWGRTIMNV
jgi:hypothetical protein